MDSTETSINKRVYAKTSSSSQENVKEESETESLVVDLSGNDSTRDKSWYMNEDGTINFDRVKEDPSGMNGVITRKEVFDGLYNSLGPIWEEDDRTEDLRKSNRYLDEDNNINFDKIREDFCGLGDIVRRNELQKSRHGLRRLMGVDSNTSSESEEDMFKVGVISDNDSDSDNNNNNSDSSYSTHSPLYPELNNDGFNINNLALTSDIEEDDNTVSEDSDDEDCLTDASGNRIRETYRERKFRLFGQSLHFREIPKGFDPNTTEFPEYHSRNNRSTYGTRVEDDEYGNHVYIENNPDNGRKRRKYVFKKKIYGPEKIKGWTWFFPLIQEGLLKSKEQYKKERGMVEFDFNPWDNGRLDITDLMKRIIKYQGPGYMIWALTLPEMLERFYDIPLPDTMSDIEKIREVFGHILCSGNYDGPLQQAIKVDNIMFVKWIVETIDSEENKKVDIDRFGDAFFDNACKNGSIRSAQFFLEKYGDKIDITFDDCSSIATACCGGNLHLVKTIHKMRPEIITTYENRHSLLKSVIKCWEFSGKMEAIYWIHEEADINVWDTDYDIFMEGFICDDPPVSEFYTQKFAHSSSTPDNPVLAEQLLVRIISNSPYAYRTIDRLLKHFPNVDFHYNNNQPMIEAIVGGELLDVKYVEKKTNLKFFDTFQYENVENKMLIDFALQEEDDEIVEYMLKQDAEQNGVSLYDRHPDKCDQIFNIMADCGGRQDAVNAVKFITNLNPQRYKVETNEYGQIVEYSIDFNIEDLNKIHVSEIDNEITQCIICHDEKSNLYTKCGHMYCDSCLLSWLSKNQTCPYCRQPITTRNVCLIKH
jgi:hypothetical protein